MFHDRFTTTLTVRGIQELSPWISFCYFWCLWLSHSVVFQSQIYGEKISLVLLLMETFKTTTTKNSTHVNNKTEKDWFLTGLFCWDSPVSTTLGVLRWWFGFFVCLWVVFFVGVFCFVAHFYATCTTWKFLYFYHCVNPVCNVITDSDSIVSHHIHCLI